MMESKIGFVLLLCFTGALAMHMKETNNNKLFEGDMKITTRQRILVAGRINKRGSTNDSTLLWLPNKVVPYEILPALESKAEASFAIMQGFREWESHTCLKFVRRTNQKDFLFLNTSCDGCWSWVGRQGGKQEVCLDSGCWSRATVTHELAHAMGFWHEQSRPDRDQYVKIVWENIEKDNAYNFDKNLHVNSLGSPYDCYSVMQYDKTSFSSNGRVTMQPIDSNVIQLGQEVGFTDADAIQASTLYQCNGVTTKKPFTRQVYNLDGSNDCTFENNLCHFTQSGMDDFDWTLRIGATPSWGTGPRVDHTTGRMGRLIYTEASYPRVKGEKARLMSKLFRGGTRCMTFFLHMYSKNATNMGTFNIYLKMERGSKKESLVFTRTASQGNQWIEHSITIASKTKFQIVLEGVIGNNYQGDIAVDDISFATGRCQVNTKPPPVPPATCQDINAREAAYCPAWKSAGLCDTYKDDIKHLCSKTCGFCNIDKCTDGGHTCDGNATCTNEAGSFRCACNSGYSGTGHNCADIDECTDGGHTCDGNATCTNEAGSFRCACNSGYSGTGHNCAGISGCSTTKTVKGKCCVFPFIYKNTFYHGCTQKDYHGPWCSLTANYDKDKQWGVCKGCSTTTVKGKCCVFPFIYKNTIYHGCTQKDYHGPWCSLTANYDKDKQWGVCKA